MTIIKKMQKGLKVAGLSLFLGLGSILIATGVSCAIGSAAVDGRSKAEFYASENYEQLEGQQTTESGSDTLNENLYYSSKDPAVVKDRQTVLVLAVTSGLTILTGVGVGVGKGVASLTGMETTHETIIDEIKDTIKEIKESSPNKKRKKNIFEAEERRYNTIERY